MNEIDKKYRKVKSFLDTLNKINKKFVEEEGIKDFYISPFNQSYELEGLITKVRDNLIEFTINKEQEAKCPNITINIAEITEKLNKKYGVLGFSLTYIKNYIQSHYLKKSETLSYQEIHQEARKALPVIWRRFERKEIELEDIWENDKLKLQVYWHTYSYKNRIILGAIEKLTKIVIEGKSSTTVKGQELSRILSVGENIYQTHQICGKNILKARPYKNGKFLLWFKNEETARRVAEALIYK